jgi:hypothetical protein
LRVHDCCLERTIIKLESSSSPQKINKKKFFESANVGVCARKMLEDM